jgi:hypothetical protein
MRQSEPVALSISLTGVPAIWNFVWIEGKPVFMGIISRAENKALVSYLANRYNCKLVIGAKPHRWRSLCVSGGA